MIDQNQLAAALKRLDPRDWEVLDLSLRRRVPDEALARIFDVEPQDVARRRAAAVENLAEELGVQRGEDLGAVLKALLDTGTWESAESEGWQAFAPQGAEAEEAPSDDGEGGEPEAAARSGEDQESPDDAEGRPEEEQTAAEAATEEEARPDEEQMRDGDEPPPDEAADGGGNGARERRPASEPKTSETSRLFRLTPAPPPPEEAAPEPVRLPSAGPALDEEEEERKPPLAPPDPPPKPTPVVAPVNGTLPPPSGPVLEMLAEREDEGARVPLRSPWLWALAGGLGAAGLFAAGYVGATQFGDSETSSSEGAGGAPRHFLPADGGPIAAPFPSDPRSTSCYSIAYVRRPVTLYRRPGGRPKLEIPARTEWRSPRVLSVVRKRGDWLAVLAPELANGEWGWMQADQAASIDCVRWSLHADLSRRRLFVRRDGHTVRRFTIAIGKRSNPTPKGRFAVTDKLRVTDQGSPYGCCVLALTGHQTKLPPDWPGGDRLAVHATSDLGSIGRRASLGCMRITTRQAGWLIRTVPLGSPMFIRR
ncbi:MAG TPA: L,D-transpeptidase [Thermoleophilaceae bacterium]|nr:L,D-transpeptidase [Thermoleophilaceae bacterium]